MRTETYTVTALGSTGVVRKQCQSWGDQEREVSELRNQGCGNITVELTVMFRLGRWFEKQSKYTVLPEPELAYHEPRRRWRGKLAWTPAWRRPQ
jgi:hypothetical protein